MFINDYLIILLNGNVYHYIQQRNKYFRVREVCWGLYLDHPDHPAGKNSW